jgi:hypothetical protein
MKEAQLEALVADLQEVDRRAGWRRVLRIGEIIVKHVYGGDREACRQPKRRAVSIRRIAQHPNCPFRKSRLAEAVGVYLLCHDMPQIRAYAHVGPSHVAAVLPLEPSRQSALLGRAERDHWSVRRIREEVVTLRRGEGERRGRPRLGATDRAEQELRRAVLALERAQSKLDHVASGSALAVRIRQALLLLRGPETSDVEVGRAGTTPPGRPSHLRPRAMPRAPAASGGESRRRVR